MQYSEISFPELYRTDTMEFPGIAVTYSIIAALVLPFFPVFGFIVGVPGFIIILYWIAIGITNATKRFIWSFNFDKRISARQALKTVLNSPSGFVLYVRYYSGGFDRTPLSPAMVLEDKTSQIRFAVYPTSWKIIKRCENNGVKIVQC